MWTRPCVELIARQLVHRVRTSSMAGEREFAFGHALARDVAYGELPRMARARKHAAAAGWIEEKAGDRVEDLAEILAHHYATALELAAPPARPSSPTRSSSLPSLPGSSPAIAPPLDVQRRSATTARPGVVGSDAATLDIARQFGRRRRPPSGRGRRRSGLFEEAIARLKAEGDFTPPRRRRWAGRVLPDESGSLSGARRGGARVARRPTTPLARVGRPS